MAGSVHRIEILQVEDSEVDVLMTKEALRHLHAPAVLHVVENGVEALKFLARAGDYSQMPRPDLILLDLNLPRKDGWDVLKTVKESEDFKNIPVIVLTTSADQEDVERAYSLHANCYISKPVDFEKYTEIVRSIETFWLDVVTLPRK
jgi:two-component system, chemotaxis family, response regulator Rcp1